MILLFMYSKNITATIHKTKNVNEPLSIKSRLEWKIQGGRDALGFVEEEKTQTANEINNKISTIIKTKTENTHTVLKKTFTQN